MGLVATSYEAYTKDSEFNILSRVLDFVSDGAFDIEKLDSTMLGYFILRRSIYVPGYFDSLVEVCVDEYVEDAATASLPANVLVDSHASPMDATTRRRAIASRLAAVPFNQPMCRDEVTLYEGLMWAVDSSQPQ